jgi:hypothetical protein
MSRLLAGHSSGDQPHATRFSLAHRRVAHIYFPRTTSRASGAPQALERSTRGASFVVSIPYLWRLSGLVLSFDKTSGSILCSLLAGWTMGHVFAKPWLPHVSPVRKREAFRLLCQGTTLKKGAVGPSAIRTYGLNPWHRIDKRHHGIKGYCE